MISFRSETEDHLYLLYKFIKGTDFELRGTYSDEFKIIKSRYSVKGICEVLKINESLLIEFERALFNFNRHTNDDEVGYISQIRLLYFMELIFRANEIPFSIVIAKSQNKEELAIKQVRAFELIIRDLITAHNGGKTGLLDKLNKLFKSDIVLEWLRNADETGILSGTTFNELAALFLNNGLFPAYENLFEYDNGLKYERRKTDSLMYFLNDIRRVRNSVAHNKKISDIQIELLNEYYREIIGRIEKGYANGLTVVNPQDHLNATFEEINAYRAGLKIEIDEIKSSIDGLAEKYKTTEKRSVLNRKFILLTFGLIFLILIILYVFREDLGLVRQQVNSVESRVSDIEFNIRQITESSAGPVRNPKTAYEFLANAILFKKAGDKKEAIKSFKKYFEFDLQFIEPHLEYQELLKSDNNNSENEIYSQYLSQKNDPFHRFIYQIYSSTGEKLLPAIEGFIEANKDFQLAQLYRIKLIIRSDQQASVTDPNTVGFCKMAEKYQGLSSLLTEINKNRRYTQFFIDKTIAAGYISQDEINYIDSWAGVIRNIVSGLVRQGITSKTELIVLVRKMGGCSDCPDYAIIEAFEEVYGKNQRNQGKKEITVSKIEGRFNQVGVNSTTIADYYIIVRKDSLFYFAPAFGNGIGMSCVREGDNLIASAQGLSMTYRIKDENTLVYKEGETEFVFTRIREGPH